MIRWLKSDIAHLLKKLLFVLLVMSSLRVVFLLANYPGFSDLNDGLIFKALLYSVRIDIATLFWLNGLFVLMISIFPASFKLLKLVNLLFVITNSVLVILLVCDNIYFSYTGRRISYQVLSLAPQSFTLRLIGIYIKAGWYWLLLLLTFIFWYRAIFNRERSQHAQQRYGLGRRVLAGILVILVCIVGIRGLESRPLSPSTVLLYFPSRIINLASNTGLNLIYTFYKGQKELPVKQYFTEVELDRQLKIFHQLTGSPAKRRPNIVLFVMESFARDYLDSSSAFKAYTPFLDSLMHKSLVFRNAFNNGRESTQGLVSILASLPPFMEEPYYHSPYHAVSIRGLGHILNESGYDCSFFLGDVDDSFGFKEFTHSIGINHYYSRKDFNDDRYYNGAWGIHDENFFGFAADVIGKKRPPFFATIFNLSSHPPYIIPEISKQKFTIPGQTSAQNSVSYVDGAYRSFFNKVQHEPWFNNTMFIFIADHFLSPSDKKKLTLVNTNAIPFFIYSRVDSSLQGNRNYVVQQLDVLPTILELAGYKGKFMSFGSSVLTEGQPRYAVQRLDYAFQIVDSSFSLGMNADSDEVIYLFDYKKDPSLTRNLFRDAEMMDKKKELSDHLKAMMQRYNSGFQNNKLLY